MGRDSVEPFVVDRADRGVFVVCKSSNKGSRDIQCLPVKQSDGSVVPLYMCTANMCASINSEGNTAEVCLVMGATDTDALRNVRHHHPSVWCLVPGVGAQGGSIPDVINAGLRADGQGLLVSASRSISQAKVTHTHTHTLTQTLIYTDIRMQL
eukprot:GHVR01176157.1.p1 GENE.GHVR01176157.1~~GHVR01176157.1.p1  ORF type:complete len:153 (-),score=56.23 GHVR01176157.1:71-529(-)